MGKEIERKYLVQGRQWKDKEKGTLYRQGYLNSQKERVVRVRTMGEKAALTIKGISVGATRLEFEYDIPLADCQQLLDLCEQPLIEKTRYKIEYRGLVWEIDEFVDRSLWLAEIELDDAQTIPELPDWLAPRVECEVTDDPRYTNLKLAR